MVQKLCGGLRLCIDYRRLNGITKKDVYPILRIETMIKAAPGHGSMDIQMGYHQILVDEADRDMTTFTTPLGTYRFVKMPMGISNGCSIFQLVLGFHPLMPTETQLARRADPLELPSTRSHRSYVGQFREHMASLDVDVRELKQQGRKRSAKDNDLRRKEASINRKLY